MTGSITPYYFKTPPSNFFVGSHCTSGSVALFSECIKYNEKKSKFYLTTKKEEVEFEMALDIIEKNKIQLAKKQGCVEIGLYSFLFGMVILSVILILCVFLLFVYV